MTESVLLIILLIALAEVINSIKNNRPTVSNIGRLFYICFKTLGLTAFNGFPCVLIIYYAKCNVNISLKLIVKDFIEVIDDCGDNFVRAAG